MHPHKTKVIDPALFFITMQGCISVAPEILQFLAKNGGFTPFTFEHRFDMLKGKGSFKILKLKEVDQ